MKIAQVVNGFFPDTFAGTEQYVLWLCNYLNAAGHESFVIAATTKHQHEYTYQGIKVFRFNVPEKPQADELNGWIPPQGISDFKAILEKTDPQVVHFHSFGRAINSYHLLLAKEMGAKTAFTAHLGSVFCVKGDFLLYGKEICDGDVRQHRCLNCYLTEKFKRSGPNLKTKLGSQLIYLAINSPFKKLVPPAWNLVRHRKIELQRLNKNCDIVIAIAPWIERVFRLNGFEKVNLVKQGIPVVNILERKMENKLPDKGKNIHLIFVGRLHPMKGLHLLIDVLQKFERDTFYLTIIGIPHDENYKMELIEKSKSLNVTWKENLPHDTVLQEIAKSDILVLPSIHNEMAPLVILEAFACGKPVIGSTYPAIADKVTHNLNGLLFKNNNTDELSKILERLMIEHNLLTDLCRNIGRPRLFEQVAEETLLLYK